MEPKPGGIHAGVRRLFRLAVRRPDIVHDDMDDEIRFHFEERVEEELMQDVRYAARGLIRRPGFTAIAVLTLAVGIGANTAIFSAVNALMFRPLPFRNPNELVKVAFATPGGDGMPPRTDMPWSWMKYLTFRDAQKQFQAHALWTPGNFSFTGEDAERIAGEWASARYFATLGVVPAMGHAFEATGDDIYDAPKVLLISDDLWKRRYNADPKIVGKTISLERIPFEVIGVMPQGFKGLSGVAELFVPITTRTIADIGPTESWSHEFLLVARLAPGVPVQQAAGAAPQWARAIDAAWPDPAHGKAWGVYVAPLDEGRVSPVIRRSLFVLFGAVGLLLLIACVNIANLLLGRAAARRQEISVRLALGAGRGRLVRMLLAESLLLSTVGGAASIAVALMGTSALAAANPAETLRTQNLAGLGVTGFSSIHLDTTALLFTLAVSVAVGIIFGLMPALQATRPSLVNDMKSGAPGAGHARRWISSRHVLVVAEVALAIVLLAGSGLMLRSLANLLDVNPGFDPTGVLSLRLTMPRGAIAQDSLPGFYDRLLADLNALPSVTGATLSDQPPLGGGSNLTRIVFPDRPPVPREQSPIIGVHWITPSWAPVMRVPLKAGRLFNAEDRIGSPKSILVSESAAKKFWPGESPVGKRAQIYQGGFDDGATVVGVVGDVLYHTIDSLPITDVYLPYAQSPAPRMMIFVRTRGEPLALVAGTRRVVSALVAGLPVFDIKTMASRTAIATAQARFSAELLAMFAGTALLLAVIGIYGVMSFMVIQRTREIGIRMALGADRARVRGLIVREGLQLAAVGTGLGLIGALAMTRVLESLLFDVKPGDPLTYLAIVLLLAMAAAIASWIPARRASQVEPTEALRAG